jgi:diadenosine tetraphosphate (Ap4A) HIT family hydrolase
MPISEEQIEVVKKQLLEQIESSQLENKEQIKEYIKNLDAEQLEEFLKQNKIQLSPDSKIESTQSIPKCIFCSIVNNETPSYKIAENKKATAILDINPLSKGHALILPNEHTTIEKLPKSSLSLAQKIAKKIKKKLKPEDVKIETSSIQEHAIINVIPIYKNQKVEKRKVSEGELKEVQSILQAKKRSTRKKKPETNVAQESIKDLPKISFRIP